MRKITLLLIITLFIFSSLTNAASLNSFESAESTPDSSSESNSSGSRSSGNHHDESHHDEGRYSSNTFIGAILDGMNEALISLIVYGGASSVERYMKKPKMEGVTSRKVGEIMIPEYRIDYHFQKANADIQSSDLRFESGKGLYGAQVRSTLLSESGLNNRLWLNQIHALYRMSFGDYVGMNMGIGAVQLIGKKSKTSLSMSFPLYFHPWKHIGFEIKTNMHFFENAAILDRDYSAIFTEKRVSISFGYRELKKIGLDIKGQYIGFSYHY